MKRGATLDEQAHECAEILEGLKSVMYALEAYGEDLTLPFGADDIREYVEEAETELDIIDCKRADEWAADNDKIARDYDRVRM